MGRSKSIALVAAGIIVLLGFLGWRLSKSSSPELTGSPSPALNVLSTPAVSSSTPGASPSVGIDELLRQLVIQKFKVAVEANHARFREMATTRWSQVIQGGDAGQRSMLREKDVAEFRQKLQALVESVDHGLSVFAEAEAKGASLTGVGDNALESNPEAWRMFRRYWVASERYHGLLERNWEEYYEFGAEAPADKARPWQKEAMQTQTEMNAAQKELEKLSSQPR